VDEAGAGDSLRGGFMGMAGDKIDVALSNKDTGLKDCQYLFLGIA
jgi:hypothetical protein